MQSYRAYIEKIPDDHVVLCVDAYDVLFLANENTILEKFYSFNAPCIFSTEITCHPFPHLAPFYEESPTKFKYLNSGSFIGYAKELKEIFKLIGTIPEVTDDQGWFSLFYLYYPKLITLDFESKLFLTLDKVSTTELQIDTEKKKVLHLETQQSPCLIHGNSIGKIIYQQLYDTLFRKEPLAGGIPE